MDNETIIKIFSTKMGITSSGLDFKNTFINSEEQDIESSSIKIKATQLRDICNTVDKKRRVRCSRVSCTKVDTDSNHDDDEKLK